MTLARIQILSLVENLYRETHQKFLSDFMALECFYSISNRAVHPEKRPLFSYLSVWCALASQGSAKMLTPKILYQKVAFDKRPWSPLPQTDHGLVQSQPAVMVCWEYFHSLWASILVFRVKYSSLKYVVHIYT